ncbi:malonyl-CoA decarboxylase [soil metagenome]
MKPIALVHWMTAVADRGRALLDMAPLLAAPGASLEAMCRDLMGRRGEATSTALAREIAKLWRRTPAGGRLRFFEALEAGFNPDPERVAAAAAAYAAAPGPATQVALFRAVEPPRQELLRRINHAPGGTAALVDMRAALLGHLAERPDFAAVDADFQHLLTSWFNRGFLELRAINWHTPASILDKLIAYEAVHEIKGWDDLRRRLAHDRRCFAFFHPAMPDEPLVFVEVALTMEASRDIAGILGAPIDEAADERATTAVFYSISNCQTGLRGISFGHFLIKQVVDELGRAMPSLQRFVTLSPIPCFCAWLAALKTDEPWLAELQGAMAGEQTPATLDALKRPLVKACARYLLTSRRPGVPADPFARFHLGNGARLHQINWLADVSPKGLREAAGMMVNYAYDLASIEHNHERLAAAGEIAAARSVRALADQKI